MCGIAGIINKKESRVSTENVERMLNTLTKRGPDDSGVHTSSQCTLGQTRLSIIDLNTGHQPMVDGDLSITFNGEIYNFKELRGELVDKGHVFKTNSDTEVILKAYREYGRECPKHLDGMFAFAIWNDAKKELFVARDRFGKKPFFYTEKNGYFVFASEIKAIFKSGFMDKDEINRGAIDDYLRFGYILPDKTIYKNINTLPPAHYGVVKNKSIKIGRYWNLEKKELNVSYEEAKSKIKSLIESAVEKRMLASDVEVGALLSGGVDSTYVSYLAQKHLDKPLKTFSVGYEGMRNELPFARQASEKIGTDHHELPISSNVIDELEKIISYMDEPHADSSNFPQHLISKMAAEHVKVVLTGDGADELFMGYGWYQKKWHMPRWRLDWRLINPYRAHQKAITIFKKNIRKKLVIKRTTLSMSLIKESIKGLSHPFHKINAFDLKVYLPAQLLTKIDRTSMMHSLEARAPFLDTELAEYVYNLPNEFKISKTENKIILKDILVEIFPKEFVYRKKQGFGAPIDQWLGEEKMREFVHTTLESENLMYSFIDKTSVLKICDGFYAKKRNHAYKLWLLLNLALWFEYHKSTIHNCT